MTILAIDLGTKCGWCRTDGIAWDSGVLDLKGGRYDGGGMRYLRFRDALGEMLNGVDRVAYEEVRRHMGVDAAHVYAGFLATLTEECERRKIPYEGIPVGTVKVTATGKGNSGKPAMMAAAEERWGREFTDDNEADARWIAATVLAA